MATDDEEDATPPDEPAVTAETAAQHKQGTIVLSRAQDGYRDLLRRYKVFIDDIEVGSIGRGQKLCFDVPAGPHRLQLRISWCSSAPLTAMVEAGEMTSFLCAPGGVPSGALTSVTTGAADYIALRPTPEPVDMVRTPLDGGIRFRLATALGFFGGGLTFIGAWIWHYTGVARDADDLVVVVSLAVTFACMLAFRLGGRRRAG